ncbi:Lichenan-specific phosphotransferase enzyme IIA component [Granulicatella adiacens]|uniref:PTS lactose/cellobiose transporter subunit IIA n=1 Tax=Granulicatella TaxID=117563 RepID=UPI00066ACC51|nr:MULTISPECIES: PTS lactose/cellobiose transporter subunit IIA [Granulicatella]OFS99018.1 PTS cellobiose transporter subunit IIA [Granulicatella sp. HMSC31F03]OFT81539.1 PTS cellobiose transporter subunit IIA [Granulicatella sp. HMSC30F09]UXY42072.1 PTS lactose/cellobiose transporter subunit IIA [Granulicatella adiacens]VTX74239.1 Lichenan-specific phosphotransferase enzyme IIA component [Granulicatella adiacens]
MTEEMELICFQLIANSGAAKSSFVEAIQLAKKGFFEDANVKLVEAEEAFVEAHKIHAELIQKEAGGEKTEFSLLFMHAEDQMASTELVQLLAQELIELYRERHEQK